MPEQLRETLHMIEHLMNEGNLKQSTELLEELSKEFPENYHVMSLLGECYLMSGNPNKAIKPLKWATKTFATSIPKKVLRPRETQETSEDEIMMVKRLQKTFNTKSDNAWVDHYLLGCAYGRCMEFRSAIRHLNIADKMNPKNAEIIRNIGWIRCMQERTKDGRVLLLKAIELDPLNALAYNDLGASYMFEENFLEARKWITKASQMDPSDQFIKNTAEKLDELEAYDVIRNKQ